jgi:ribonuclease Z
MSDRELVILGTASQVPTRHRNHNGYLLRWDGEGLLFDPGEGVQRQFTLAGVSVPTTTRICITHFHGDHCLGLPGVILRLALDQGHAAVPIHYPATGQRYFDRLRLASAGQETLEVDARPVAEPGVVHAGDDYTLRCARLRHRVDSLGWRLEEPDGRHMLVDRLDALGIEGPAVGALQRDGRLDVGGRTVTLDEVSTRRRGQSFAFVMDTAICDAAFALAEGADLVVCESTFLSCDEHLAEQYGHLTARQAGRIAAEAGARRLVLSHFSARYPDPRAFAEEAGEVFPDVVLARDLARVAVPPRIHDDGRGDDSGETTITG